MKKITYLLSFVLLTIFISCEREIDSIDNFAPVDFAGEWKVNAYIDTSFVYGPFKIITTQESTNSDSITVKDSEVKFWKFQAKANKNTINGTFETKLSNCEVSDNAIGIIISNGKIINSDSIYFEIKFEDDETPFGNNYKLKGTRVLNN